MKTVAYLTMADMGDFVTDFHLSIAPMAALGWQVYTVDWRRTKDWGRYDAVYICTPWDYPEHLRQFMQVLESIDKSRALMLNELSLVRWNLDKRYLLDVEQRGHDIVPTRYYERIAGTDANEFFDVCESDRVVVKPAIGANAKDTFVLHRPIPGELRARLGQLFRRRAFLVQPYIANIEKEGEYSLFFFNGVYSHAICKVPEAGDFRVQEEHGASIIPVEPDARLEATATALFADIEPLPTYGRGDWVPDDSGSYRLMELELIEPSLYLRTSSGAAARFAAAVDQRFQELTGKRPRR